MRGPNAGDEAGVVRLGKSNSAVVMVIPKPFIRTLKWHGGDHVALHVENGRLYVTNVQPHIVAVTTPRTEGAPNGEKIG